MNAPHGEIVGSELERLIERRHDRCVAVEGGGVIPLG